MKKYFLMLLIATALALMPSVVYPADVKVSALPASTAVTSDDLMLVVDDPSGSPATKKITVTDFLTGGGSLAQGDVFYWSTNLKALAPGTAGQYLRTSGSSADPTWSVPTYADSFPKGSILYASTGNTITGLTHPGLTSRILYTNGSDTIGWLASSANMISLLGSATYAAARTNLGLAIGTNVQAYNARYAIGPASPSSGYMVKWGSGYYLDNGPLLGTFTDGKWCTYSSTSGLQCISNTPGGGGTVTAIGDCTAGGACFDGSSDGGTSLLFYDAQGATTLQGGNTASAVVLTLPIVTGTLLSSADLGVTAQAYDTDLAYLAGFTPTANVKTILEAANNAAIKSSLGYYTSGDSPTFTGMTASKQSGVAGFSLLYEKNSTDTNGVGWMGPDSRTGDLYLKFPDADPSGNQVLLCGTPSDGVSSCSWAANGSGSGDFKADGSVPMTAAIVPNASNTIAIGSTTAEFADLYLGDGAVVYFGNDQDVTLTHVADTGLTTNLNFTATTLTSAASATPNITFFDSDNAGADEETAKILVNAETTTDGAEDGKMSLQVMVGGTDTTYIAIDGKTASATITPNTTITGDLTVSGSDITVGSAGVKLTGDGDGAITFLGLGNGSDEDLTMNLDDTANTVTFSSSTGVTDLNFSALNLVTTGTVSGKIPMITKSGNYTLGTDNAQEAYGYMVWLTGDGTTLTLPAVAAGMSVCVYSADSYDKGVDPNASDGIRNGTTTRNADGHKITSGATDQGSFVCLVADSADGWTVLGKSGTWTDE